MKNLLITLSLVLGFSFAQDWYEEGDGTYGWLNVGGNVTGYTYNAYDDNMNGYAVVSDGNGNSIAEHSATVGAGDLLGVFDENGGLRMVAATIIAPFGSYGGQAIYPLVVAGAASDNGSTFSYKFYDASSNAVTDISETLTFAAGGISGSFPILLA